MKGIKLDYAQLPAYPSKEFVPALSEYIQSKYPEIPVYMALTMYSNYTDPIKEKLYIVGLAYLYSEHRVDNIALIRKNLENHFRLDYLDFTWYGENYLASGIVDKLNMNYVAGMVILAEHYQKSGLPDLARKWAQKALSIAEKGGVGDQMLKDLEKKGIHL
ncbi:MAG: hypothetical protein EH225_05380 [Calditrichaeota bacterium]|nr:MAG: hypothetical protein EH225_05380 [Calditrichota bacterium]